MRGNHVYFSAVFGRLRREIAQLRLSFKVKAWWIFVAECVLINGLTRFKAPIPEEIFYEMFSIFVGPGEGLVNC